MKADSQKQRCLALRYNFDIPQVYAAFQKFFNCIDFPLTTIFNVFIFIFLKLLRHFTRDQRHLTRAITF